MTVPVRRRFPDGTVVARRWRITRFLAAGGMGDVYEAEDLDLGVRVALKTVRAVEAEVVERFKREVQLARRVTHPNVCRIFDLGFFDVEGERIAFLTMELLNGEPLAERIKRGPMAPAEALPIARQMAAALDAAHAAGVIHRDFKSSNVMLCTTDSGIRAVVTDFGLALAHGPEMSRLSLEGALIGTPDYMAPEQFRGGEVGPRTDQYALAVVLFEMLAGALPFDSGSLEKAAARTSQPAPSVRSRSGSAPRRWDEALRRALARDPAQRFPDLRALVAALEDPADARPRRWGLAFAVGLTLIAAALGIRLWQRSHRSAPAPAAVHLRPSLAVLGFHADAGRPEDAWLGTAFAELLATEFAAGEQLRVAPGEAVGHAKKELQLPDAGILDKSTLERVHRRLNVDWVVAGRYGLDAQRKLTLDVELDDAHTGAQMASFRETGTEAGLLELVARAGGKLRIALGLPAADADRLRKSQPQANDAARLYAEGVERFGAWDYPAARDKLQRAIELEPSFALAHSALADTWLSLGYENRAADEAQRAIDLAGALSQKDKLVSEARLRKAKKEWPRAIEVYRSLFTFYPDEITWGLQLARAQTMGGKSGEALKTVESLRRLPPPLCDDPLIDLREAHARSKQGDWKGWRAANERVVKKARTMGARGLIADAEWGIGQASGYLGEYAAARAAYEESQRIWTELGDRRGTIRAGDGLAGIAQAQGDFETAKKQFEQSLAFNRELGDEFTVADRLDLLAEIEAAQGHVARARQLFDESMTHWQAIHEKEGIGNVDGNYGEMLADIGELAEAERKMRASLVPLREVGMMTHVWAELCDLAGVKRRQGQLDEARRLADEGLKGLRGVGDPGFLRMCLSDVGRRLRDEDRPAEAKRAIGEALALAWGHDAGDEVAWLALAEAELVLDAGRAAEALAAVRAVTLGERAAADLRSAQAELEARALLATGDQKNARTAAERARTWAAKGFRVDPRLRAAITGARAGECRAAERALDAVDEEARTKGMVDVGLESKLARVEVEARCGHADAAREHAAALAGEATRLGFARVARLASAR